MKRFIEQFWWALCGVLLALASFFPGSWISVSMGLLAICLMSLGGLKDNRSHFQFFLSGLVFYFLAFYWLSDTMHRFGGFPELAAFLIFSLFCGFSALQFLLISLLNKWTRPVIGIYSMPVSVCFSELFFPRLFPWSFAHYFLSWGSLAQLAEVGGVQFVAFIVFLLVCSCFYFFLFEKKRLSAGSSILLVLIALCFGSVLRGRAMEEMAISPKLRVSLIQGDLSLEEKQSISLLSANVEKYKALTQEAFSQGAKLLIWPESVVNQWYSQNLKSLQGSEVDFPFAPGSALIFGALSYTPVQIGAVVEKFNSAFSVDSEMNVQGVYHKRVLMPFGEYLPLSKTFPWIKEFSPQTADFTKGTKAEVFSLSLMSLDGELLEVKVSPLICYEDLVPSLSRDSVLLGANLLVNLTNDAWYGKTHAPYQHDLLAVWRAIEFRRYFLRSTNTGYTSITDPLGRNIASLDIFSEGVLSRDISLLQGRTLYSIWGDYLIKGLVLFALALSYFLRAKRLI